MTEVDLDELSNSVIDCIEQKQWSKAEELCGRLRELFPEEIDADDRLAQVYQARENYAKAIPYAQAALDKARRNPDKFHTDLIASLEEQLDFLKEKASP